MTYNIFVDGQEGTTGLRIHEMLARRSDVEVLRIDADKRKDTAERARLLNAADVAFLCLPDAAAREAVALVDNPNASASTPPSRRTTASGSRCARRCWARTTTRMKKALTGTMREKRKPSRREPLPNKWRYAQVAQHPALWT